MRLMNENIWNHPVFVNLNANSKLVYFYVFAKCDYAGFLLISIAKFSSDLKLSENEIILSLEQLSQANLTIMSNGLLLVFGSWRARSTDHDVKPPKANKDGVIPNRLFHNKAHIKILSLINEYLKYFDDNIIKSEFEPFIPYFKRHHKGLPMPTNSFTINDSNSRSDTDSLGIEVEREGEEKKVWASENENCDICETTYGNPCKKEVCQRVDWLETN